LNFTLKNKSIKMEKETHLETIKARLELAREYSETHDEIILEKIRKIDDELNKHYLEQNLKK